MKQIKRTKIADALKSTDFGSEINVKGWVRTRRGNKNISFVALNDGSTINNLQIVIENAKFGEEFLKPITTGACICVNGILVQSLGREQTVEVQAHEIEIYGTADPATYPLQKKGHSLEFLREIAHLRPRTNTFGAIFRIRHHMSYAIHKYFHDRGFYYFHTPIIPLPCRSAGALFRLLARFGNVPEKKRGEYSQDFWTSDQLTVSGQPEASWGQCWSHLHVWPTFRENSNTQYLAEFDDRA